MKLNETRLAVAADLVGKLLVHNGRALTYNGSFGWMDLALARDDTSGAAHWKVTTDHDGFHLKNELGYTLTYGNGRFYGVNDDAVNLNQVVYYLNSRLMVHDHDVYYQFGTNGSKKLFDFSDLWRVFTLCPAAYVDLFFQASAVLTRKTSSRTKHLLS